MPVEVETTAPHQERGDRVGPANQTRLPVPRATSPSTSPEALRQRRQHAGEHPGHDHQKDDRPAHPGDDRLGVGAAIAGQSQATRQRGEENRPEATLVRRAGQSEPGHSAQKDRERQQSTKGTQVKRQSETRLDRTSGASCSRNARQLSIASSQPGLPLGRLATPAKPNARRRPTRGLDDATDVTDEFTLFDLKVEVVGDPADMVCDHRPGDSFELSGRESVVPTRSDVPALPVGGHPAATPGETTSDRGRRLDDDGHGSRLSRSPLRRPLPRSRAPGNRRSVIPTSPASHCATSTDCMTERA